MKTRIHLFLYILVLVSIASCTIQKRHYSKGFYFSWNNHSSLINKVHHKLPTNPTLITELPTTELQSDSNHAVETNHIHPVKELIDENPVSQKQHSSSVRSEKDTIPKRKYDVEPFTPEERFILESDHKFTIASLLTMLVGAICFVGGALIVLETDLEIGYALLGIGTVGFFVGLAALLVFVIISNAHLKKFTKTQKPTINIPEEAAQPEENNELKNAEIAVHRSNHKLIQLFIAFMCFIFLAGLVGDPGAFIILGLLATSIGLAICIGILIHRTRIRNKLRKQLQIKKD